MARSRRWPLRVREVREETGLEVTIEALVAATLVRDDPRALLLVPAYLGRVTGGTLRAGDDAAEVRAFAVGELPPIRPAYHREQLDAALVLRTGPFRSDRWVSTDGESSGGIC